MPLKPTAEERAASEAWTMAHFGPGATTRPFSFIYGGQSSASLIGNWKTAHSQETLDESRTAHTLTFTDPDTGLEVRAEAIAYRDFPAVEWVLHFKNVGASDTPILEHILPIDTNVAVSERAPILHYAKGALCCIDDFAPVAKTLEPKDRVHLQPGGGRRIDLESIGRSTALHRTDWARDSIHAQCHSYGLFQWVPLQMAARGGVLKKGNEYEVRSVMTAGLMTQLWEGDDGELAADAKRLLDQYLSIRKFYYGDYYPLTPYSQDKGVWIAWQFDLPEDGSGLIQAFRRQASVYESARLHLSGLEPDAHYVVTDMDTHDSNERVGRELMEAGLVVHIPDKPGAVIMTYKKSNRYDSPSTQEQMSSACRRRSSKWM